MKNFEERRDVKRRKFTFYMPVTDNDTEKLVGYLTDISDVGFRLDSPHIQPTEKVFNLRLELATDLAAKPFLVFVARSKWCREDKITPNTYNVGFQIMHLDPADVRIFKLMIQTYGAE